MSLPKDLQAYNWRIKNVYIDKLDEIVGKYINTS